MISCSCLCSAGDAAQQVRFSFVFVKELSEKQKELLQKIANGLDQNKDAEAFQTEIYEYGKALGLNGKETFAAIYAALIGKNHGPKAAWLILSLDKDFVKKRFQEV